jgi:hypothetical protein
MCVIDYFSEHGTCLFHFLAINVMKILVFKIIISYITYCMETYDFICLHEPNIHLMVTLKIICLSL